MRAWRRGVGGLHHPTRSETGRALHPPKESQPDVRAKPSRAALSDVIHSANEAPAEAVGGVRRNLTGVAIATNQLRFTRILAQAISSRGREPQRGFAHAVDLNPGSGEPRASGTSSRWSGAGGCVERAQRCARVLP